MFKSETLIIQISMRNFFFEGTALSTSGNIGEQEPQYFGLKSIFCIEEIYSQVMQY